VSYQPKNPNGQATMANSEPVVIASNQTAVPVSGTFFQATQPVSIASSVPVTDGGGSLTVDGSVSVSGTATVSGTVELGATSLAALETVSIAGTVPVSFTGSTDVATQTTLAALNTKVTACNTGAVVLSSGTVTTVSTLTSQSQWAGQAISLNAGTAAAGTLRVIEASAGTGTQSNPSLSTTSATLLAASTSRRGASVYNGSTSICYIRLSSTAASSTVYSVLLNPGDYYEVPGNYNGAITAILNTGTTTLVQVTQVT
jgi:hypothetical protein